MNWISTVSKRLCNLKGFFVFYRKPKYIRTVKRWLDIRPEDIPAVETSDCERLCKHPLVSVYIATYNQEAFIRQAIDSALAQRTDFEYEILVGDDCSSDGTGAICAEYQRRHPDKIRFITADRNVSKLGGNGTRLRHLARGEFLAPLEGDDFWTDTEKLQKQIEVFRSHPDVTLCLCGQKRLCRDGSIALVHNAHFEKLLANSAEPDGTLFTGDDYFAHPLGGPIGVAMFRKADIDYIEMCMFYYRTSFTLYFLLLKKGKGFLIKKPMTMYRLNPNGVWSSKTAFEKAKFSYEFFSQLLLHDPGNESIMSIQREWWHRLRRHLFPWKLLFAIWRRKQYAFMFTLGLIASFLFSDIHQHPDIVEKVNYAHHRILSEFLSPDGLLYAYKGDLPNKDECEKGIPNALGYWTPIENTPMFTGSYLSAMVSRAERLGDYTSAEECRKLADGLVKIASVSDIPGMIVRGFGQDGKCHYSSTTTCQYIPWFLGLHSYATSRVCPPSEKRIICETLVRIAEGLAQWDWRCPCDGPLDGCFFGRINSQGLPHRDSAHYLFVLAAMYDVTGDELWLRRYNEAKNEICEKLGCTRLEACARGWNADKGAYDPERDGNMWIYVCTQECLSELYRLDADPVARDCFLRGMLANAAHARPQMKLARKYDNDKGREFKYANWREGYSWSVQTNTTQALEVSRTGNRQVLGTRKQYERKFVSQPLCAAAICAYAGMYKDEVFATISRYEYDQINISEFFFGEVAYWKYSELRPSNASACYGEK